MNKTELVNAVAGKTGSTKVAAKAAVEAVLEAIAEEVKNGGKVQLPGFGAFAVKERPAHEGINPATKQNITIAAKKVVTFKPYVKL